MFTSLGAPEILIIGIFWILPAFILYRAAQARGLSPWYAALGVLGLGGLVLGLLLILVFSRPGKSMGG
ncbi:MAG: hypothetical protein U0547_06350 [Dehalococcoidia bacterium]